MATQTFKLLAGALALRKFTKQQLADFTRLQPSTVSSWINRSKFIVGTEKVERAGRGRRHVVFEVLQDQLPVLEEQLRDLTPPQEALFPKVALTEGLGDIDEFFAIFESAEDDNERDEVLIWLGEAIDRVGRQMKSRGVAQPARDRFKLLQARTRFHTLAKTPEHHQGTVMMPPLGVDELIVEHAGLLLEEMEREFVWARMIAEAERVIAPLVMLAAMGMSYYINLPTAVKANLNSAIGNIGGDRCAQSLHYYWKASPLEDRRAFPPIAKGIIGVPKLLNDDAIGNWMGTMLDQTSARSAPWCTMLLLKAPNSNRNEVVPRVSSAIEKSIEAYEAKSQPPTRFQTLDPRCQSAVDGLETYGLDFAKRVSSVASAAGAPTLNPFNEFAGVFTKAVHVGDV